jgi:hypothetical protein
MRRFVARLVAAGLFFSGMAGSVSASVVSQVAVSSVFVVDTPSSVVRVGLGDVLRRKLEVANQLSGVRLDALLLDDSVWFDVSGVAFYKDVAPTIPFGPELVQPSEGVAASAAGFLSLHSKPGSSKTIYLNFGGFTATDTFWGAGSLVAGPFDTDGVPGSASVAEQQRISEIWSAVAEDFVNFDVDVTTESPSLAQLDRSSAADPVYGIRVVITSSPSTLIPSCGGCGGVAVLNAFDSFGTAPNGTSLHEYRSPVWVFAQNLSRGWSYGWAFARWGVCAGCECLLFGPWDLGTDYGHRLLPCVDSIQQRRLSVFESASG